MHEKAPSNIDIVVVVLAQLGGATRKVHTEEIAATAYELAPDRFSWTLPKYRSNSWPDKQAVRFALENEKRKDDRRIDGDTGHGESAKDGWRLSPAGAKWVAANRDRILEALSADKRPLPSKDINRFRAKLKSDNVFKKFAAAGNLDAISQFEFTDLLLCSPDAPPATVRLKFDRLLAVAHMADDNEIVAFLQACERRFATLLGEQDRG